MTGQAKNQASRPAILALEDGTIFEGSAFGAAGERCGEVVFNTSMTGYQEVLTDPSYRGQIVAMTYPLIGNYGVNAADAESRSLWLEGFVVKELSRITSNFRSETNLDTYLRDHGVLGIEGIDTRELTRRLRTAGAMKAVLSTEDLVADSLVAKAKASQGLEGRNLAETVTCEKIYQWDNRNTGVSPVNRGVDVPSAGEKEIMAETAMVRTLRVVVLDCGVKYGILNHLASAGCEVTVVPASTEAEQIAQMNPDGLMLSNGPGDPEPVSDVIKTVRKLIENPPGKKPLPIFGICLGQQILALALGGKTFKLKFGHHGANHPVKDLHTGKVAITVQNHGFCVDIDSLPADDVEITHINLNDQTLEGFRHKHLPIFSVQYHPEARPGPHDAQYLFDSFVELMRKA
ncbi:MAG: glutamine-hydrolyzing carbamoyl-phosphate synthase small subunit [Phycisphaerae bacterium]|nr:glutamine-hydrolyzing carbamoyl-phosphate synthase small subunit [Phycisphaerae bacterium]